VHDLFQVLGLSQNASLSEIRRACARRTAGTHPDFRSAPDVSVSRSMPDVVTPARDTAVDFVDMPGLVARIQSRFFRNVRQ
jgi:hypothetical protein